MSGKLISTATIYKHLSFVEALAPLHDKPSTQPYLIVVRCHSLQTPVPGGSSILGTQAVARCAWQPSKCVFG